MFKPKWSSLTQMTRARAEKIDALNSRERMLYNCAQYMHDAQTMQVSPTELKMLIESLAEARAWAEIMELKARERGWREEQ